MIYYFPSYQRALGKGIRLTQYFWKKKNVFQVVFVSSIRGTFQVNAQDLSLQSLDRHGF
jgi:hypothetical protein